MMLGLKDITLCSIVKNEEHNTAGGLKRFLEAILPYVGEAVIVYSPSQDNTQQILEKATESFPNLRIFQKKFDGYANLRNHGVKRVRTKYALTLDADELLTAEDFSKIDEILNGVKTKSVMPIGFNFKWRNIYPDKEDMVTDCPNPRLFEVSNKWFMETRYRGGLYEHLHIGGDIFNSPEYQVTDTGIEIKHFCSSEEAMDEKREKFYKPQDSNIYLPDHPIRRLMYHIIGTKLKQEPDIVGVPSWKQFNPKRDRYSP
jgi:glycosyltransferase involved in cell wall biosynthesis